MEFKEVVKNIEESEKRVDEVLDAARLERHEREPMSIQRLMLILNYTLYGLSIVLGFVVLMYIIYLMGGR